MKKALLFTIDFAPRKGGVANYYKNICRHFPTDDIFVLASRENEEKEFDTQQKYKIYRKNLISTFPVWPKWTLSFLHLHKIVKKEKIDIILVGQILPLGTVAYIYKKIFKTPYAVFIHGMDIQMACKNKRKKYLTLKILKDANFIIVNSNYTKNLILQEGIAEEKINVIYPGVEKNIPLLAKEGVGVVNKYSNNKILLTLGRLVKRKGQDMVIKSLPSILEKFPNLIYIIAGEGPDKEYLENLAKENNVEKNVIFAGKIKDEEKSAYYNKSDIFIMPARDIAGDVEGFGIVYLEAGLHNKPVIAGRSGGAIESVLDEKTGLLVDSENIGKISSAVIKLLFDKELASNLGRKGKERALTKFNWEKQVEKIKNLLN